jgi:hypothetical protein
MYRLSDHDVLGCVCLGEYIMEYACFEVLDPHVTIGRKATRLQSMFLALEYSDTFATITGMLYWFCGPVLSCSCQ